MIFLCGCYQRSASRLTNEELRIVSLSPEVTEILFALDLGDNIVGAHPDKEMLRLCGVRCPHMNQITLEAVRDALLKTQYVVEVPEDIRVRAAKAVERMIAIG